MELHERVAAEILAEESQRTIEWLKSQRPNYREMLTGDLIEELLYLHAQLKNTAYAKVDWGEYALIALQREKDAVQNELYWRQKNRLLPHLSRRRITPELIKEAREKNTISQVLSKHGIVLPKEQNNTRYKIPCPFHQDDTASFQIEDSKGLFHCFGCKKGGDIIRLVMLLDKASFQQAVLSLGGDDGGLKQLVGAGGSRAIGQAVSAKEKLPAS